MMPSKKETPLPGLPCLHSMSAASRVYNSCNLVIQWWHSCAITGDHLPCSAIFWTMPNTSRPVHIVLKLWRVDPKWNNRWSGEATLSIFSILSIHAILPSLPKDAKSLSVSRHWQVSVRPLGARSMSSWNPPNRGQPNLVPTATGGLLTLATHNWHHHLRRMTASCMPGRDERALQRPEASPCPRWWRPNLVAMEATLRFPASSCLPSPISSSAQQEKDQCPSPAVWRPRCHPLWIILLSSSSYHVWLTETKLSWALTLPCQLQPRNGAEAVVSSTFPWKQSLRRSYKNSNPYPWS